MTEYDKIIKLIDNYKTISFDIFDTLLLRNVRRPTDIFSILERNVEKKYGIKDFKNRRIEAEKNSRTENNNYETTLDEIYNSLKDINKNRLEQIKNMEIELEEKFIVANPFMKKVFNYCREKGKKIICITDMYLPLSVIKRLLNIGGYYDVKIYLSCAYHKHKGNGTLFEQVYNESEIKKEEWLHIGDNYNSDYLQPIRFGINAYHYKNVFERSDMTYDSTSISNSIIFAIRNNLANNGLELPYWKKFAIINAVPIYFGFAKWIYDQNKDHDNIYFLARDGYFIKKVFDLIAQKNRNKIDSHYLYTSRRAIQLPATFYEEKTAAIDTISCVNTALNEKIELNKVFKYFDLDINNYSDIIKKYNFEIKENEIKPEDFIKYKQMISEIYDSFEIAMKKKINTIKKYLKQEKVYDYKRVNIVDIGWRGSVQYALDKIIGGKFYGYYFATSYVYNEIFYNTKGYLLNYCNPMNLSNEIFPNIALYEFLFSAPEGTLLKFKEEGNKIVPILKDNEDYGKEIKIIQDESLKVIKSIIKYYDYLDEFTPLDSIYPYKKFLSEKNFNDLVMFSNLKTDVGYSSASIKFVPTFTRDQVLSNESGFFETINKSLWNNTFLIEGIYNEAEYKSFLTKLYGKEQPKPNRIKNALKHPIRAIKKIIKIILKNK